MTAKIVERAQLTPGTCFLSGDFNGPFIDTGVDVRGRGRVYLALKHIGPIMRQAGWVPGDEAAEEFAYAEDRLIEALDLEARAVLADELVAAIAPLLPTPDPVVRQVAITDPRLEREVTALRDEVTDLEAYLEQITAALDATKTTPAATPAEATEGSGAPQPGEAPSTVEVAGQTVDIDALLDRKVGDIVAVAEGWPDEALYELVACEIHRAEEAGKDPRVTVLNLLELDDGEGDDL